VKALLGFLLLPSSLLGQETAVPPSTAAVQVKSSEVQVLVQDRRGQPVLDLRKDEFRLYVNGRSWPIDWTEPPPAEKSGPSDLSPAAEPRRAQEAPAVARAPRGPHSTIYLVDNFHVDYGSRRQGLLAMERHLETLPPDEEVAVYVFDLGIKMLQRFTRDRHETKDALELAGRKPPGSSYSRVDSLDWVSMSSQALRGFSYLFRTLSGRPEAKTVVILAGYLPRSGFFDPQDLASVARDANEGRSGPSWARKPQELTRSKTPFDFHSERDEVVELALLANATVICLDPAGVATSPEIDSSEAKIRPQGVAVTSRTRASDLPTSEPPLSLASRLDTLVEIATATGGVRLSGSNAPDKQLREEARRLDRRYRLGFTPPDESSNRREIRVEVARPCLSVRAAPWQRTLTSEEVSRGRFAALLLAEDRPPSDFEISLEAVGESSAKESEKGFKVEVMIPLSEIHFTAGRDGRTANVEVLMTAMDGEGRVSPLQMQPISLRIPGGHEEIDPGSAYRYSGRYVLESLAKGRFWVGVRDRSTNRLGYAVLDLGN
jgi:VWFA-related protein